MTLPVTAFVAAVCALLLLATAIDTVRQRLRLGAAFGDHGDAKLISASRAHGNLAEYAPIVVILLGLLESARANHMALMVIGAVFLIGRVAHVVGLYTPSPPGKAPLGRQVGVLATFASLLVLGGWTLWILAMVNL
ncbi:MAPEG family protein [Sphingopyxis sp. PET50]|uniref:MAPEG family protein n=1 Tax=Sphingopyxis sp. PET50 TaxID=2976533 RepID=UPI0021AF71DE|nr:MAPEG family protein [Sphingopyxis sp. PET50]